MVTEKKWVYKFNEGNAQMRELLGGKGAEACTDYYKSGRKISNEIKLQIFEALRWLEKENGKKFGDNSDPLLVSVRSGARVSMPGMMDTILNLGMNDISVKGFAQKTNNPRFAYDSYRRFIQMFSDVVMEVPKSKFEKIIDEIKEQKGVKFDIDLDVNDMKKLIKRFKASPGQRIPPHERHPRRLGHRR